MEQRDERMGRVGRRAKRASIAGIMASFPIDSRQRRGETSYGSGGGSITTAPSKHTQLL